MKDTSQKKKILIIATGLLVLIVLWQREMVAYLWMQGKGQMKIISNTVPILKVLESDTLSPKERYFLHLIPEIKEFARTELGLTPKDNYTEFYNQKGQPILWALTACSAYNLEPYLWSFPILGNLEYKGFFDKNIGEIEKLELEKMGYDVDLGEVSAWSTLGILSDPLLSSMLELDTGRFVRLLIHELTHTTIYISDDAIFNENLATYVGDNGGLEFMKKTYGTSSSEVEEYQEMLEDIKTFTEYTVAYSKSLELTYASLPQNEQLWPMLKERSIQSYKDKLRLIPFNNRKRYSSFRKQELNNTFFTGFLMYHNQQDSIQRLVSENFNGSIKDWISAMK